jgi:solute carrier family 10 (sodium/bile acid cotransporter), member 7
LAGLGLRTSELVNAFKQLRFNVFVQTFNFGLVSSTVFLITRLLININALDKSLADGMVICACLPMSINMVFILSKQAGGDEAAAIFNAAFGNMSGVFLSPLLILGYLGVMPGVNMGEVFYKLSLQVVLPVIIGQLLQKYSTTVVTFAKTHKSKLSAAQQYALLFIIYTVFCRTFYSDDGGSDLGGVFLCILFQFLILVFFMIVSWLLLRQFFPDAPELRVMGLFGCTHKTVAMGVPMINAIYSTSPYLAQYIMPLIIWYPLQLILGSLLVPHLLAFVKRENERLQLVGGEVDDPEKKETDEEAGDESSSPGELEQDPEAQETKEVEGVALHAESMLTGTLHVKAA